MKRCFHRGIIGPPDVHETHVGVEKQPRVCFVFSFCLLVLTPWATTAQRDDGGAGGSERPVGQWSLPSQHYSLSFPPTRTLAISPKSRGPAFPE